MGREGESEGWRNRRGGAMGRKSGGGGQGGDGKRSGKGG